MKHLANGLTLSRIVLSFMLIFMMNKPAAFLTFYVIAGFTDVLDGWIARRTNTVSENGAKLDSSADLLMFGIVTAALVRWSGDRMGIIWPYLAVAVAIRLATAVYAACKYRTVAMIHTWGNKLTGLLVFVAPLIMIAAGNKPWVLAAICIISTITALEELLIHLTSRKLEFNRKSLFVGKNRERRAH
ncbi:CDP-alcohol phosphatidyltransferase family protein [Paenibacillus oralis]|uniref:CDP-alcohol phosphatidyltransferase family protein n=1 Tax=Paenibacillus oralis TaxID=2490856 RepID=A0A3P3U234_9BACL|nr:CDP-alcohol phosphatidyltransferase family protein [Paenibacillus oralis]RRJ64391.1 CDP-alcohol phosphatidyltransferase family protein [Paenibacillus oralis]